MATRRIIIPRRFIRVDSGAGTAAVRGRGGRFRGRRKVSGRGDTTRVRRITRDFDIDGDGRKDPVGGLIYGRTVKVRATDRNKAFRRSI